MNMQSSLSARTDCSAVHKQSSTPSLNNRWSAVPGARKPSRIHMDPGRSASSLDRSISKPSSSQMANSRARSSLGIAEDEYSKAARALLNADFCLISAGAGLSADSGLPVYKDIADVEAYRTMGVEYHDLCDPIWLRKDPEVFFGFWGKCLSDYRSTTPHDGYTILKKWTNDLFSDARSDTLPRPQAQNRASVAKSKPMTSFGSIPSSLPSLSLAKTETPVVRSFVYTSNVDQAFVRAGFNPNQVFEIHGNIETWQCSRPCSEDVWMLSQEQRIHVDLSTMRAPQLVSQKPLQKTGPSANAGIDMDQFRSLSISDRTNLTNCSPASSGRAGLGGQVHLQSVTHAPRKDDLWTLVLPQDGEPVISTQLRSFRLSFVSPFETSFVNKEQRCPLVPNLGSIDFDIAFSPLRSASRQFHVGIQSADDQLSYTVAPSANRLQAFYEVVPTLPREHLIVSNHCMVKAFLRVKRPGQPAVLLKLEGKLVISESTPFSKIDQTLSFSEDPKAPVLIVRFVKVERGGFAVECVGFKFHCANPMEIASEPSDKSCAVDKKFSNHIRCAKCNSLGRPNILMFDDEHWIDVPDKKYRAWRKRIMEILKEKRECKVVIIELGCGKRVPTVRQQNEQLMRKVCNLAIRKEDVQATLVRINLDFPECTALGVPLQNVISIKEKCLPALQQIDFRLQVLRKMQQQQLGHKH
ncbi:conserved mitochondrial SIR2 superfamily protein [Andalucia godoyi]|uniref:Conserved mitochondrial SIR2 superfamily protein n=1 Tax=Andalucia godoyi TaxID=505711 RepID=A0A8K0AIV9_ANDGO|nr:conserved mitochondrial SIR2 superfamily protein [Andalucia godoyi]|eukprot:ANDGO_02113.mRNA.1 conserved mitochondrial SIR2 superfamily protein